jgi:hypothetical protein
MKEANSSLERLGAKPVVFGETGRSPLEDTGRFEVKSQADVKESKAANEIGIKEIAGQFRLANTQDVYNKILSDNPRQFDKYVEGAKAAQGPADWDRLISRIEKNGTSQIPFHVERQVLSKYFNSVHAEVPHRVAQGRSTRIDALFKGAKTKIDFGNGDIIEKGGDLAIENKVGQPGYLSQEVNSGHLPFQLKGHERAGATSLVFVSKDVYNVPEIRSRLDSKIISFFPEKNKMDQMVLNSVMKLAGKETASIQ